MYERILRLFNQKKINKDGLASAVSKRLITEEEFEQICNLSFDAYEADKAHDAVAVASEDEKE